MIKRYSIALLLVFALIASFGLPVLADEPTDNWTIEGDTVYIDDENVYMAATPHTIKGSSWVEFELISKRYEGEVDVVWGFDSGKGIKPKNPQIWSENAPHEVWRWVEVEKQGETTYYNILDFQILQWDGIEPDVGNENNLRLVRLTVPDDMGDTTSFVIAFNSHIQHSDTSATFFYNYTVQEKEYYTEYYPDWKPFDLSNFTTFSHSYQGVDNWHFAKLDATIQKDTSYKVRCWVEVPFTGLETFTSKYVWGIKPHNETILEAKQSGHLYILDPWLLGGWDYRMKLTTDQNDVGATETNFPVRVYLSTSSGRNAEDVSFVFDALEDDANRKKIAVTLSDGTTQCYVEIERWDDASEKAELHVKMPSIAHDADTDIYLYYDKNQADNDAYVGDAGSAVAENVWSNGYVSVYHYSETAGNALDSVGNNDGTVTGATQNVAGQIDGAYSFTDDDKVFAADDPSMNWNTELTVTAWVYIDDITDGYECFAVKYDTGTPEREWWFFKDTGIGNLYMQWGDPADGTYEGNSQSVNALLVNTTWQQIGVVFDNGAVSFVLNGVEKVDVPTNVPVSLFNGTADIYMGLYSTDTYDLIGDMDEVRISNVARTFDWLATVYQSDIDDLIDFGVEEERSLMIPGKPLNFTMVKTGVNAITITWDKGLYAENTTIRIKEDSYPIDMTDGYEIYSDNGTSTTVTGLNIGMSTYYALAWSWGTDGYSTDYAQDNIGGDSMALLAIFALTGILTFATFRLRTNYLVGIAGAISWIFVFAYTRENPIPGVTVGTFMDSLIIFLSWGMAIALLVLPLYTSRQTRVLTSRGYAVSDTGQIAGSERKVSNLSPEEEYRAKVRRALHPKRRK